MPTTAAAAIDLLLARTRDPLATATSRFLARQLVSLAQPAFNIAFRDLFISGTLTTERRRLLYRVDAFSVDAARIDLVRVGQSVLPQVPFSALALLDRNWFRRLGPQHRCWAALGREWFILYPGREEIGTVTVLATKITARLGSEAAALELPDVRQQPLLDFVETLMLARRRLFESVKPTLERLGAHLRDAEAA